MMPKSTATSRPSASTNRLPGCMSAWKKPSRMRVAQEGLDQRSGRAPTRSWPAASSAAQVGQPDAVDPFGRQHVARGQLPVGLGARGNRRPRGCSRRARRARPPRAADPSRSRPSGPASRPPRGRAGAARRERSARTARAAKRMACEVAREPLAHAGPQHLDGDEPPAGRVGEARLVDLRDRGGGDRLAEARRRARRAGARAPLSTIAHGLLARERRHAVLQPLEVARDGDADDVGPGRQELAELDVGRAEPRQRRREPGGAVAERRGARSAAPGAGQAAPGRRQHARIDERERALARQHEAGADVARRDGARSLEHDVRSSSRSGCATMPPVNRRWVTRRKPAAAIMRANGAGLREAADRFDEIAVGLGIAGRPAGRARGMTLNE